MSGPSARLLRLLSLLQSRREWPAELLAARLEVSDRTVRRDVERLRGLGYPVRAVMGPDGGYRLESGATMPPLLLDDEQVVALAIGLRAAVSAGAGIGDAAARALGTLRQVMPARLRHRIDAVEFTAVQTGAPGASGTDEVDPDVLVALTAAVRAREVLRFDYLPAGERRRAEPHHVVSRAGRWYLVGWDLDRGDWRTFRADRIRPRSPNGPRFTPRDLPGGVGVDAYVAARFKGASGTHDLDWPCRAEVILDLPADEVAPFAGDGIVEEAGPGRCRLTIGSWSWPGLVALLGRFDAPIEVVGPAELRAELARVAERYARAATG